MLLIILATVLVIGLAFFQVTQGAFSALIMAILSVVSAMIAFTFYEPLAALFADGAYAYYAPPIALLALFAVPLLLLRLAVDRLIGGNVVFGVWGDRILGGALGLVTGTVLTGMILIILQMLPLGASVFTYRPFDDTLKREQRVAPFYPDEAVLNLVTLLSRGSFSADKPFDTVHDNLLLELYCSRNQILQPPTKDEPDRTFVGTITATADELELAQQFPLPAGIKDVPDSPLLAEGASTEVVVIRAGLADGAADADGWYRLPATHFRLLVRDTQTGEVRSHYPVAYLTGGVVQKDAPTTGLAEGPGAGGWQLHAPADAPEGGPPLVGRLGVCRSRKVVTDAMIVDWVFRLRSTEKPERLVFRRVAAREVAPAAEGQALTPARALRRYEGK